MFSLDYRIDGPLKTVNIKIQLYETIKSHEKKTKNEFKTLRYSILIV